MPEFEIYDHMGANFTYDVIQPRYVRQMIDWFRTHKLGKQYDFRILWFQPPIDNFEIAKKRQNMPNDLEVRRANTCNLADFRAAKLYPDHIVTCSPYRLSMDDGLRAFLHGLKQNTN